MVQLIPIPGAAFFEGDGVGCGGLPAGSLHPPAAGWKMSAMEAIETGPERRRQSVRKIDFNRLFQKKEGRDI